MSFVRVRRMRGNRFDIEWCRYTEMRIVVAAKAVARDLCADTAEVERVRIRLAGRARNETLAEATVYCGPRMLRVQLVAGTDSVVRVLAEQLERKLTCAADGVPFWGAGSIDPRLTCASDMKPIVRRKLCHLRRCSPGAAAVDLEAGDYNARLFIDADTGEDSVVFRPGIQSCADPLALGLRRLRTRRPPAEDSAPYLFVVAAPAAVMTETAAMGELCAKGLATLFFIDDCWRRGRLLYRRYDQRLGLVIPISG
ncbi:sigma 54 modulation/S30EA ribosomal C-terminal domain-containing protein [Nocardia rhizosphaerae]|uniref:Sigma 54 modulation/S30EA ribosomal C-terminal domain-containing protein n=1 Tax=Nocardia rhizosphaerae TaxID=1691571 RepID=A0ABV8L622_9NOCA